MSIPSAKLTRAICMILIDQLIDGKYLQFYDGLIVRFDWSKSKQGHEFWNKIARRTNNYRRVGSVFSIKDRMEIMSALLLTVDRT